MWRHLYRYFMSLHYCWMLCPQSVAQGPENRQLKKEKKSLLQVPSFSWLVLGISHFSLILTAIKQDKYYFLKVKSLSCVQLFATPWTIAYQAPSSMGFSRQGFWSGLPFPSPEDLPNPGIKPGSPILQADALSSEPPGKPLLFKEISFIWLYRVLVVAWGIFHYGVQT